MVSNVTNQPKLTTELGFMCYHVPSETYGLPSVKQIKKNEIQTRYFHNDGYNICQYGKYDCFEY